MKIRKYMAVFLSALAVLTACSGDVAPVRQSDLAEPVPEGDSRLVYGEKANLQETPGASVMPDAAAEPRDGSGDPGLLTEEPAAEAVQKAVRTGGEADECIRYTEEDLEEVKEQQAGKYHYGQLPQEEKTVYAQILKSMQEFASDVEVSTLDPDVIERDFQCVMNDHPEIFYIQGFSYIKYTLGDELKKISFSGTYTMDKSGRDERLAPIRQYCAKALSGITDEMDDYEKIKTIYRYIVEHTEYDSHSLDNQNICSVFLNGRSVCQGYAKAMQYLLNEAGVDSTLVLGTVSGGQGHAWNLVKSDGEYYYVDVTWGDASYRALNDENSDTRYRPSINYDYLCVTTEQICRTHQLAAPVQLPVCVAVKDNYYRREGALFSSVDKEKLRQLFDKGYESDTPYITLKCTGREVYDAMYEYLITEQHIFKYLSGAGGSVNYTNDDNQLSMSFWL